MPSPDTNGPGPSRSTSTERRIFLGVWLASALLGFVTIDRGWLAHDVGTLGHAAERVLGGELPHRDFVDVYTGGQAVVHALAFRLFGVHLMTLRWVFLAAYLLWVPVVWLVARGFARPALAAVTTVLAASLTLPVYPEGMPSWYNLFFATAGAACLLRWTDDRRARWLALAGLAGGASILFKIVGLFYVAAGLLFLVYLEAVEAGSAGGEGGAYAADGTGSRGTATGPDAGYRAAAIAACVALGLLALYVVSTGSDAAGLLHFAVPPLAAVGVVAARLGQPTGLPAGQRWRRSLGAVAPFLAGVVAPVLAFSTPYALSGALGDLVRGVFVLPRLRLEFAAWDSPPLVGFLPALALVAWIAWRPRRETKVARAAGLAGGAVVLGVVATTHVDAVYRVVWWTLRSLGPIVAVTGAWVLARGDRAHPPGWAGYAPRALLLLAAFGFCNLVQIPFAAPIYFLYAAPLLVLAAVALARDAPGFARPGRLLFVSALLLAFAGARMDTGFVYHLGFRYRPHRQTEALELERARGVRVTPEEKQEIERLVQGVLRLDAGDTILALPDAPEVYFLTGLHNPTPNLFEFFDGAEGRTARVLTLLDEAGIGLVVLNRRQLFSPPVEGPLLDSLQARFGWSADVGRFRILVREPPGAIRGGAGP